MSEQLGVSFLGEISKNDIDILAILKKVGISETDIVYKKIASSQWKVNKQEMEFIYNYPEKIKKYLEFRAKFRFPEEMFSDFPAYIVVEPSSICNLRCSMCFQQDEKLRIKSEIGTMSMNLWKAIIDEAYENGCQAITIAGRGEPLVNREIADMILYCKNKFLELKLNTNGLLMNDDVIYAILESGMSTVVFSNEAYTDELYKKYRCGDPNGFQKFIRNIERFNEIRGRFYKGSKVITRICGVEFDEIDKDEFYSFWMDKVDEVALTDYEERVDTYNNTICTETNRCSRLWQRVYIWQNGIVSPCDIDYLHKLEIGGGIEKSKHKIYMVWEKC